MDYRIMIQGTPNPNALKFVLNAPVKTEGNCTYKSLAECADNPLAKAVFVSHLSIREVYFFDNYITVTQDGSADWDELEEGIKKRILENIGSHDPNFTFEVKKNDPVAKVSSNNPSIVQINSILDQTVRPALQMDGGDIQVINYENNRLTVFYQGACGSCPSSSMGTMKAIENILRDQFNPEIVVELAETF